MTLEVGDLAAVLRLDDSKFNSGLASAESRFSSLGGKLGSTGAAIAGTLATAGVAAGAALGGIATAGLMAFMDVESAASSAASKAVDVSGKSAEEIKAQYSSIQDHVINISNELAATTVFDPTQVAQAFDVLAAKGVDIANVGKTELLPFLDLASGTQTDLATATDLVTGTINSFGLSMSDSATVADQLAMAMNGSSAGADTLNYALRQGGSTAAATGMEFAEFASIVGTLSDMNYTGEQSGAALKTAMLALYNPTDKQTAALQKLGLTYDQVDPRTHKFTDTIKLLASKGADIGDFGEVFTDSSGAIMYALSGASGKVDELTAKIAGSSGLASAQAGLIMDTDKLVGAWETAKGATEGMVTAIGGALEPAAVSLLNTWTSLVPKIQEFAVALASGDWGKAGEILKEAFSGAWEYIKAIDWGAVASTAVSVIKAGWQGLQELGAMLLGWLQSVDWGSVASTITGAIQGGWNALASLGADLAGWIRDYDWSSLATSIADLIKAGWAKITGWASSIISGLKADWDQWIASNGPSQLGESLGKAIATGAKNLGIWIYDSLKSWFSANGASIGSTLGSLINFAASAAKAAWDFATSFGSTILTAGKGTIGAAILEIIGGAMDSVWEGAGDSLRTKAQEWRADADKLFAAEDFDIELSSTYTGAGDPRDLSKTDIPVNFKVSVSGDTWYLQKKTEKGSKEEKQYGSWMPAGTFGSEEAAAAAAQKMAEAAEKVSTATDGLAAATTAQAAATQLQADTTTAQTAQFISTAEKANALTMGIFETSAKLMQSTIETAAAAQQQSTQNMAQALAQASERTLQGSQAAARALQGGAEISSRSLSSGGQAVMIGLTASGQEIAVIGKVAQQNFVKAGGDLYGKVTQAGANLRAGGSGAADSLRRGGSDAANALSSAVSRLYALGNMLYSGPASGRWYSSGTETTGPEVALIGEAGREWVIPERTKRWDLLYSAMRAYGIRGLAGGGVARSMSSARRPDTPEGRAIVIEDHTSHHWYLDGREVTNQIMKSATRQIRFKGAMPSR